MRSLPGRGNEVRLSRRRLLGAMARAATGLLPSGLLSSALLSSAVLHPGRSRAAAASPRLRLLKVRHSTFLLELDAVRVLVDPCFSRDVGLGPLFPANPPALRADEVGALDLLLVTSGRPDHFDGHGVRRLRDRDVDCLVPDARVARRLSSAGFSRVRVVSPGERFEARGVRVDVSPSQDPLGFGPAVGFRLAKGDRSVWHTGAPPSVEVFPPLAAFAQAHPSEVVLACWDGRTALGRRLSLGPDDGELIAALARARLVIPQHDGAATSSLAALLVEESPRRLAALPEGPRVIVVEPGVWYRVAAAHAAGPSGAPAPAIREGPP